MGTGKSELALLLVIYLTVYPLQHDDTSYLGKESPGVQVQECSVLLRRLDQVQECSVRVRRLVLDPPCSPPSVRRFWDGCDEEEEDLFSSDDSLLDPSIKPGQLPSPSEEYESDSPLARACSKVLGSTTRKPVQLKVLKKCGQLCLFPGS